MKIIRSHSTGSAHELAVKIVLKYGYPLTTEEGEKTIECEEIYIKIDNPLTEPRISTKSDFGPMACKEYARQLIEGGKAEFDYDYHERLFVYPHIDESEFEAPLNQIEYMIEKLKTSHTSRRAVAITWKPDIDHTAPSVPCLQLVMCTIRYGKLDMKVVFRSNDMLSALGPNMYGLTELQKYIADAVGVPIGTYTHISLVPHVYHKRDETQLVKMLAPETMYGIAGEMAIEGMRI